MMRNQRHLEINLSQYHFIHHENHMNSPGIELKFCGEKPLPGDRDSLQNVTVLFHIDAVNAKYDFTAFGDHQNFIYI